MLIFFSHLRHDLTILHFTYITLAQQNETRVKSFSLAFCVEEINFAPIILMAGVSDNAQISLGYVESHFVISHIPTLKLSMSDKFVELFIANWESIQH